jgi:hypothetical protein
MNYFYAPNEQMTEDMESLTYVACDLEGSVSISNKQGAFHLPSGGFPRANVSPLLFVATMFSILPFKLQDLSTSL